jgi:hypothetical protein
VLAVAVWCILTIYIEKWEYPLDKPKYYIPVCVLLTIDGNVFLMLTSDSNFVWLLASDAEFHLIVVNGLSE